MDVLIIFLTIANILLGVALFVAYMAKLDRAYEAKNRDAIDRANRRLAERRANDDWHRARRGGHWPRDD